jgi:hypothetical protein
MFLATITQYLVSQQENLPGKLAQKILIRIPPGISENSEVFCGFVMSFGGD